MRQWRKSIESVLILESKSRGMKNEQDVFNILHIEAPDEANLRSCAELGHGG